VLNALRNAAGTPVGFSELRKAGVEFPASIVSELELSGIAIQRCRVAGGREPGVRLVPAAEPPAAPAPTPPANSSTAPAPAAPPLPDGDWTRVHRYRTSTREGLLLAFPRPKRLLAPVALVVAIIVVVAIFVTATGLGAGSSPRHERTAQRTRSAPATVTTATQTTTTTTTARTQPATPAPTPVSFTLATQLESQGHELLTDGQAGAAVPILKRALNATGETVNGCVDPDSSMCLTYAYALYDLGRALRLSGNPAAAVPILEARLQIDNQRPTVLAELELARQAAA
jgi:hypothetical protein